MVQNQFEHTGKDWPVFLADLRIRILLINYIWRLQPLIRCDRCYTNRHIKSELFAVMAAAHRAVRNVFPNVITKGCLFHFGQCLIRNVQRLSLMPLYKVQDSEFKGRSSGTFGQTVLFYHYKKHTIDSAKWELISLFGQMICSANSPIIEWSLVIVKNKPLKPRKCRHNKRPLITSGQCRTKGATLNVHRGLHPTRFGDHNQRWSGSQPILRDLQLSKWF
uniref:MULE transposase domain-containing protein n=1 Tax=Romanomermis culicivorax TaxID=13658 RepID=A0A915KHH7_ROMCU